MIALVVKGFESGRFDAEHDFNNGRDDYDSHEHESEDWVSIRAPVSDHGIKQEPDEQNVGSEEEATDILAGEHLHAEVDDEVDREESVGDASGAEAVERRVADEHSTEALQ